MKLQCENPPASEFVRDTFGSICGRKCVMSVSKHVGADYGTESLPHGPEREPRSHTEPFMRFLFGTEPNLLYLVPDQGWVLHGLKFALTSEKP